MAEYSAVEPPRHSLLEYPAVEAWKKLWPARIPPRKVVILKPEKKRSAVYRLEDAGPDGSPVIAKRGRRARIAIEMIIYRDVLSYLPLSTLQCYGSVEDQDPEFAWLFLEDAGDERYSSGNRDHRVLAAQWLAALHTSTAKDVVAKVRFPDRGLTHYRNVVRLAGDTLQECLANPALSASDLSTLHAIHSYCEILTSHWHQVEEICETMPKTIVHGDFSAKNVRMRRSKNGLEILPLDWDDAGWGIAAADLSQTDIATYRSNVRHHWPSLSLDYLKRLVNIGRMFWNLDPITGEAESLGSDWVGNVMRKMTAYEAELADALEVAGWRR